MRRVLDHFGVKRAVVVGRDWGGGVALEFALREPRRVRALLGSVVSYRDEAGLSRLRKLVRNSKGATSQIYLFKCLNDHTNILTR